MRKIKIYITILLLYELTILTILQIPDYCFGVFNFNFCDTSFRYFLMCIVIPCLFCLLAWWWTEISSLFCKKCQCEIQDDTSIKNIFKEIISKQDIEKFITAAVIMGIQKFAATHPKTKETFDNILNVLDNSNTNRKSRLTK